MSPIYPSIKVQMSEQRMIDVLDDYRLEKDKKEQVKLEHKTYTITGIMALVRASLTISVIPIAVGDRPCDSGISGTRQRARGQD